MTLPRSVAAVVVLGQCFYTAGDSLAGGYFLAYYLRSLSGSILAISLLLVLPEIVATAGLLGQTAIRRLGSAKRVWLLFAIIARLAGIAIAGLGLLGQTTPIAVVLTLLAVLEVCQAISYAALIAWLVRLVDHNAWGRLFGTRQVAISAMLMAAPLISGRVILARFGAEPSSADYATVIAIGQLVTAIGIGILASLPADTEDRRSTESATPLLPLLRRLLMAKPTRRTLMTSLHLAAANGLTQLVFFAYSVDHLKIDAATNLQLTGLMFATQIPLALIGGWLLDRYSNRSIYLVSLALVAMALPFWLLAIRDVRLLTVAYVVWGLFGVVNIAGRNTMLRLCPTDDAAGAVAAFRFTAGLVAGLSGLVGGGILSKTRVDDVSSLAVCMTLIAVSFAGRLTAPLWLLGWSDGAGIEASDADDRHAS